MFNVAVVNIKDLIKYLVGVIIAITIIVGLTRYFSFAKINNTGFDLKNKIKNVVNKSYIECINDTIPVMEEKNEKIAQQEKINNDEKSLVKDLLKVELAEIETKDTEDLQNLEEATDKENEEVNLKEEQKSEEISTNETTEVVTENPIETIPTDTYGSVQIRNQTSYVLTEDMLAPNIEIDASNIIIFHTHTCESYTPTEQNQYEASGTYRTTDSNYSVAKVGDELTGYLEKYGYNVVHDKTYHDYPAYTGSYSRSLKTVEELMKTTKADIVIDLHRDAIGSNNNYAPLVRIGNDYVAQLMFVIGTDGGGLYHPNWEQNLKFAVAVQQKAEELYPGLFKPIILRNSRYNQHVSNAATIIEVGATGNTLEQCQESMKYLSTVLSEVMK